MREKNHDKQAKIALLMLNKECQIITFEKVSEILMFTFNTTGLCFNLIHSGPSGTLNHGGG